MLRKGKLRLPHKADRNERTEPEREGGREEDQHKSPDVFFKAFFKTTILTNGKRGRSLAGTLRLSLWKPPVCLMV